MIATPLTDLLGLSVPLIQAPMGGGPTTPALVAAVSAEGALGSVAGGYLPPAQLRAEIAAVRALTDRPFAVNVFAPHAAVVAPEQLERAQRLLEPLRIELGLPPRPEHLVIDPVAFDDQLEVLLDERPRAVSSTFGAIPAEAARALHDVGCVLVGTATSTAEAVALVDEGADVVCAQGSEAGAHRGTFLTQPAHALVGTLALVPQIADAVDVPVVAAGGIMDGRGIAAVLALGAAAAQLGTAFLRCPEAGTSAPHRAALADADDTSTVVTSGLTGRAARGIENRLLRALDEVDVPAYPVMHALTAELRRAAAQQGRADLMSLWAGQGVALGTEEPAAALVRRLAAEADERIVQLAALRRPATDVP